MIIRTATTADAEQIRELTLENVVHRNSGQEGLVEYPVPSVSEIRSTLTDNPFFYVAEKGKIIGYLANHPSDRLPRDPLAFSLEELEGKFIYCDVVSVQEEYRRQGIAEAMFKLLFS